MMLQQGRGRWIPQECSHFICCSVWWHHPSWKLFLWTFSFHIHGVEILFNDCQQWEMHGERKKGVCLSVTLHKDLFPLSENLDTREWVPQCLSVICTKSLACSTVRSASYQGPSPVDQGTVPPFPPKQLVYRERGRGLRGCQNDAVGQSGC